MTFPQNLCHFAYLIISNCKTEYKTNIPPSNCFDNPARASYYIAICTFYIQETDPIYDKFVILTNYKGSDILHNLKNYSLAILRKIIIKELFPYFKDTQTTSHIPHIRDARIKNMAVLILYCSRKAIDEEFYEELLSK